MPLKKLLVIAITVKTLLVSSLFLILNPFFVSAETKKEDSFTLTILHNNDTHANLDNVAKTVTAVKKIRMNNPNALLLHAGDVFTGTLYFHTKKGKADLQFKNLMGYDVMTFGNHEFDLGSSSEGHQALVDFVKNAKFPFVSSNIDFSRDDKFNDLYHDKISTLAQNGHIYNSIIKEVNGEKIGIFGLTTKETTTISSPGQVIFSSFIEKAKKAVKEFENMGVNKIIALTHIGFNDNAKVDNDLLLAMKVDGIDIIVGGHSHTELTEPVLIKTDVNGKAKEEPTVIVQAGEYNTNLGMLNVTFDNRGKVIEAEGDLLKIENFEEDPEAVDLLNEYKSEIYNFANQEIGVHLNHPLENPRSSNGNASVRNSETILANLITDGMLYAAKKYDEKVLMAVQNGGGIRAPIEAGPITNGKIIQVLPFGNTLSTIDLTGIELKKAFEHSVHAYPEEFGGFLHIAGGKVEFDSTKAAGERVVAIYFIDENGDYVKIKDIETYTIVTNYFTAKGGDGYDIFQKAYEEGRVKELGKFDWDNFRQHLQRLGSANIPTNIEGRIIDVGKNYNKYKHPDKGINYDSSPHFVI